MFQKQNVPYIEPDVAMPAHLLVTKIFGPGNAAKGHALWESGAVVDYFVDDDQEASGDVIDGRGTYGVSIWLDEASPQMESYCDCERELCAHAAALFYALLTDAQEAAAEHPLSALNAPPSGQTTPPNTPPDEQERLAAQLLQQTVQQLRQIAQRRNWPLQGVLKEELVRQIVDYMITGDSRDGWLDGLNEDEHDLLAALNTLYNLQGVLEEEDILAAWQKLPGQKKGTITQIKLRRLINGLQNYGLIYSCQEHYGPHFHTYVTVSPESLPVYPLPINYQEAGRSHSTQSVAEPAPLIQSILLAGQYAAAGSVLEAAPPTWKEHPNREKIAWIGKWPTPAEEVTALLKKPSFQLSTGEQRVTLPFRDTLIQPATVAALQPIVADDDKAGWLIYLMSVAGLLTINQSNHISLNEGGWHEFMALNPAEKWRLLFTIWTERYPDTYPIRLFLRQHPDLSIWRVVHPDYLYDYFGLDLVGAQSGIVRLLRSLVERDGAGVLYKLDDFAGLVHELRPDCFYSYSGEYGWGFRRGQHLLLDDRPTTWLSTYGRLLTQMFTGPLYWLGVVDIQESKGQPVGFSISEIGQWLLKPGPEPPVQVVVMESETGSATWLNDYTIEVKPGVEIAALITLLGQVGEPTGTPFTYHLHGAGLQKMFAEGQNPDTIAQQFAEAGTPLPEASRHYLQALYDRYGQVHLYEHLTVMEFSDDFALAEVRTISGALQRALIHELGPRLIVIDGRYAGEIMEDLVTKGYTPRLTHGAGTENSCES